ncbi:MAG: lysophospholipid acyltransferase family protein [Candidatus Dormibacteria bacterium]
MLPYHLYRVASLLVRVLPRRASLFLADRVADVLLVAVPAKFDALRDNLRLVLPDVDGRELNSVVRRNLRHLSRSWVDVMAIPLDPQGTTRRLREVDLHHYTDALARGKGVVVVSMHFGAWEAGLAAWNGGGGQLALLAEQLRPQRLFEAIAGARGALGVKVIPIDIEAMLQGDARTARRIGAAAMREVFKHLRSGGGIAIAIDRDLSGTGARIPFFGKPAPIPLGVVEVAMRSGAAVVPVAILRTRAGAEGLVFPEREYDPDAPREQEAERIARDILAIFETVIRKNPEQWHVLDPVWPEPKA